MLLFTGLKVWLMSLTQQSPDAEYSPSTPRGTARRSLWLGLCEPKTNSVNPALGILAVTLARPFPSGSASSCLECAEPW